MQSYVQPATVVTSRKGPVLHYGLTSDRVDAYGRPYVVHASPRHGNVVETPIQEFSAGTPVRISARWRYTVSRREALRRARSKLGKPYGLLQANCEHLVRWATQGRAHSSQLLAGTLVAAGLVWALSRR